MHTGTNKKKSEIGLVLHLETFPLLRLLTLEQCGKLLQSFYAFAFEDDEKLNELTADPAVSAVFETHRSFFEKDIAKYISKCERNRQIAINREESKRTAARQNEEEHERTRTYTNVHQCSPIKIKENINKKEIKINSLSKESTHEEERERESGIIDFFEKDYVIGICNKQNANDICDEVVRRYIMQLNTEKGVVDTLKYVHSLIKAIRKEQQQKIIASPVEAEKKDIFITFLGTDYTESEWKHKLTQLYKDRDNGADYAINQLKLYEEQCQKT